MYPYSLGLCWQTFLAIFYVKFWLLAPLTNEAARNDLEFNSLLYKYQEVNKELAETVRIN